MKFIQLSGQFLLAAVTMMVFFSSCKKDEVDPPVYPVEGLWVGKYGAGTSTPTAGFSMVVESGGKVTVADCDNITNSAKATGTWALAGNVFTATYTYTTPGGNTFSIKADWSNSGKMTNGTYGPGSSPTGGGTWFMNRVN